MPGHSTLLAITVFTPALAGCLLLLSWLQHRRVTALALCIGRSFAVVTASCSRNHVYKNSATSYMIRRTRWLGSRLMAMSERLADASRRQAPPLVRHGHDGFIHRLWANRVRINSRPPARACRCRSDAWCRVTQALRVRWKRARIPSGLCHFRGRPSGRAGIFENQPQQSYSGSFATVGRGPGIEINHGGGSYAFFKDQQSY